MRILTSTSEQEFDTTGQFWWTMADLAEHYKLGDRTIYAAIEQGDLVAHRFGTGRTAIRVSETDRTAWETGNRAEKHATSRIRSDRAASQRPGPLVRTHSAK